MKSRRRGMFQPKFFGQEKKSGNKDLLAQYGLQPIHCKVIGGRRVNRVGERAMSFPYVCTVSIQYDETMGAAAAGERSRGFTTGLRDLLWAPPGNETGAGQAGVGPVSLSLSLSLSLKVGNMGIVVYQPMGMTVQCRLWACFVQRAPIEGSEAASGGVSFVRPLVVLLAADARCVYLTTRQSRSTRWLRRTSKHWDRMWHCKLDWILFSSLLFSISQLFPQRSSSSSSSSRGSRGSD